MGTNQSEQTVAKSNAGFGVPAMPPSSLALCVIIDGGPEGNQALTWTLGLVNLF